MTNDYESSVNEFLNELHEFIDWTNRWGSPRDAREETAFFELQNKILEREVTIKPFVHSLRNSLESFLEDFRKEPHAKERIGNEFIKRATELSQSSDACVAALSEEDQQCTAEINKMLNSIKSIINQSD